MNLHAKEDSLDAASSLGVIYHMPSTFSDQFPVHRLRGSPVPAVTHTGDSIPNPTRAACKGEDPEGPWKHGRTD